MNAQQGMGLVGICVFFLFNAMTIVWLSPGFGDEGDFGLREKALSQPGSASEKPVRTSSVITRFALRGFCHGSI